MKLRKVSYEKVSYLRKLVSLVIKKLGSDEIIRS